MFKVKRMVWIKLNLEVIVKRNLRMDKIPKAI